MAESRSLPHAEGQLQDVLRRSAAFLYRQGVSEGAVAVDHAIQRMGELEEARDELVQLVCAGFVHGPSSVLDFPDWHVALDAANRWLRHHGIDTRDVLKGKEQDS